MNFIGHAYVALESRDDEAFILGAMLPDFFGMARIRGAKTTHPQLQAGITFHHGTDEAFHGGTAFLRLCALFTEELDDLGLRRGPSRAVAHVGLELLLDGLLLDTPGLAKAYLRAVAGAAPEELGSNLVFTTEEQRERYSNLSRRLAVWGLPVGYRDPAIVADRLGRILGPRPRLALHPSEAAVLPAFLGRAREAVAQERDALLAAAQITPTG